jgi:crotonobetaine/carnitine-CoA ligase
VADPGLSLVDHLLAAADRWPDRTAWTFDPGSTLSFREVAERSAAYAQALHERGVAPGDRVAVMLDNQAEFPLVWLALMRIGAAMVPLNVRYRSADAGHVITDAGVRLAVTSPSYDGLLGPLADVVLVEDLAPMGAWAQGPVDPGAVVNVQYTSGTTGHPKGCVLTHRYWTTLGTSMLQEFPQIVADDVLLTAQPFFYLDPQWNVVTALMAGAHLVALDGFHPSTFWAKVREHEVTYFYCLAAMPTLLLKMPPDPLDRAHRVRVVQCSAIPPALHAELEERWGVPWFECFGMTETGADIRVDAADHDVLVGSGSLGRPAAHRSVKLVDSELWLRGPGMMEGYLGRDSPFVDGWFPTGDLARLDDEGRVYLTGRLKDMIRRSGENIAAREVEDVLLTHPAVRLAAVVGVPDEIRGEEVKAYVVAPGSTFEELDAWCRSRLAGFKVPRFWEFRDDLPLTASLRVEKAKL